MVCKKCGAGLRHAIFFARKGPNGEKIPQRNILCCDFCQEFYRDDGTPYSEPEGKKLPAVCSNCGKPLKEPRYEKDEGLCRDCWKKAKTK